MNKSNVFFVGNLRGFLKHLINNPPEKITYKIQNKNFYEVNSKLKIYLSKIFKSPIADKLGIILNKKLIINDKSIDIIQTYNKFITTNKPYIINLENPTALYHYRLNRSKSFIGKKRLESFLKDNNLKAIVCISKACKYTANELLNNQIEDRIILENIYPYIPLNSLVNNNTFDRVKSNKIKCLFISSDFELKGGQEILKSIEGLNKNIEFTIITKIKRLDKKILEKIFKLENVNIIDFNLKYGQLSEIYESHDILLHPTRQDSFALVILEAIKSGMCILSTDLYAIPEMVDDGINGFLIGCKYYFFDKYSKMPNPEVWNNRKKTIYSNYIDNEIVNFLIDKINYLEKNREVLKRMKKNSFKKASVGEFSEEVIKNKWGVLYERIKNEK